MVNNILKRAYYACKPLIPRGMQIAMRQKIIRGQREKYKDTWPIDERAGKKPDNWNGWPGNRKFAFILTHDVDTKVGQENWKKI
jgi:hypothetical protein